MKPWKLESSHQAWLIKAKILPIRRESTCKLVHQPGEAISRLQDYLLPE